MNRDYKPDTGEFASVTGPGAIGQKLKTSIFCQQEVYSNFLDSTRVKEDHWRSFMRPFFVAILSIDRFSRLQEMGVQG